MPSRSYCDDQTRLSLAGEREAVNPDQPKDSPTSSECSAILPRHSNYTTSRRGSESAQLPPTKSKKSSLLRADELSLPRPANTCLSKSEQTLKVSEAHLRCILEQLPFPVWTLNHDLQLTSPRDPWGTEIGGSACGRSLFDILSQNREGAALIKACRNALCGTSSVLKTEHQGVNYVVSIQPLRAPEGQICGALGISNNEVITEPPIEPPNQRKRTRSIAHDFNNLLTAIMGQCGLLSIELPNTTAAQQRIEKISCAATRASELATSLMAPPAHEPMKEKVELLGAAREVLWLLDSDSLGHIQYSLEGAAALPPIRGTSRDIRRLIFNLVQNAKEAIGDAQGEIRLTVGAMTHHELGEQTVYLEVYDNGPGISPEAKEKLFESDFTTKPSGHGLGLMGVVETVREHGGRIQLASSKEKGTSFRIFFPIAEPSALV